MNKTDYDNKISELLNDGTYKKLNKDPTTLITKNTKILLSKSKLPEKIIKELTPTNPLPPRLYGLPKIHKNNQPLRPIVSAIDSPTYQLARYLTTQLTPFIGNTTSYIQNSFDFINKIKNIKIQPQDILVSFDVVSLFTKIPIPDTIDIIQKLPNFPTNLIPLIKHCLTNTYFSVNNQFYEQTSGTAMGSPISPIIANIFMEHFETNALKHAPKKPTTWFRYVDDTFVIWPHGKNNLNDFFTYLNSLHPQIKFTMEIEQNNQLPFLDVLVYKKPDNTLGHTIYRKPTHTNRYLHATSHHHPSQKQSVINSLVYRAINISDKTNLQQELNTIRKALLQNGYSPKQINRIIKKQSNPTPNTQKQNKVKPIATTHLPYIQGITEQIGRVLNKHNIRTVYKPPTKIGQILRNPKDKRPPLLTPGIYRIPCSCGKVYIGETGRTIAQRIKEHQSKVKLKHITQSALAEHHIETGHTIEFEQSKILSKNPSYFPRKYQEAIEILKHPNNLNRDKGYNISPIWKPLFTQKTSIQSHTSTGQV